MSTTIETITDAQIKALRREAKRHGDTEQVRICLAALAPGFGREDARTAARLACVEAIRETELA